MLPFHAWDEKRLSRELKKWLCLYPSTLTSPVLWLSAQAAKSPMFTNVEATPLSGKRFVGKRQGISRQITRQTASVLQGCEEVISEAEGGDPDKGLGLVLWKYKLQTGNK